LPNTQPIRKQSQNWQKIEDQKARAQALLDFTEDDHEEREALEKEIVKFENWAQAVAPLLTDPTYQPTYQELRLAIRILGIVVTVYPTNGDFPRRVQTDATIPEIMEKMGSIKVGGGTF
jgi:hypothetical protein